VYGSTPDHEGYAESPPGPETSFNASQPAPHTVGAEASLGRSQSVPVYGAPITALHPPPGPYRSKTAPEIEHVDIDGTYGAKFRVGSRDVETTVKLDSGYPLTTWDTSSFESRSRP
jgi:hypothetical protein